MVEWIISNKEWIFSGLGIAIISAFFAILKTNLTEEKQQSNIKIVDISLNEDKEFIVDIKLRNIGDQVAYIKEISFDILDYYNMINPQMTHYRLVESSHTYDVVLGKEKQQVFNVSQSIVFTILSSLPLLHGCGIIPVKNPCQCFFAALSGVS